MVPILPIHLALRNENDRFNRPDLLTLLFGLIFLIIISNVPEQQVHQAF